MLEKYLNHFVSVLAPFMTSASSACHAGGDNTGVLWQEYEMDLMRQLSRTCHELKFIWLKKRLCRKVEFIKLQRKLDKFKKNSVVKSPLLDGRRSSSLVPFNCVPFGARSDSASAHSRSSSSSSSSLAKKGTKLTKLEREVFEAKLIFHHCHVDVANDLEHLLKVVLPLTVVLLKRHFFLLLQFTLRKKDLSQKKGWLQNYSESSVNARTLLQPLDSLELLRA